MFRYDLGAVATVGTVAPCFDEPLPSLPLPGADDDLFGPASPGYVHEDVSPTFEKPLVREIEKTVDDARFIAQHAKNKDRFESVSTFHSSLHVTREASDLIVANFSETGYVNRTTCAVIVTVD